MGHSVQEFCRAFKIETAVLLDKFNGKSHKKQSLCNETYALSIINEWPTLRPSLIRYIRTGHTSFIFLLYLNLSLAKSVQVSAHYS